VKEQEQAEARENNTKEAGGSRKAESLHSEVTGGRRASPVPDQTEQRSWRSSDGNREERRDSHIELGGKGGAEHIGQEGERRGVTTGRVGRKGRASKG